MSAEYSQSLKLLAAHETTNNLMDLRQQQWMQAQTELEQLRGLRIRLEEQLNDAQYQLDTQSFRAGDEIDALKSKLADIDQQLANSQSRRAIEIRAPGAGRVTSIIGHPGQMIAAGAPMLTIVPEGADMQAELLAPSRAVGFIRAGERVRLRYSAFPYQKFGQSWGRVVSVADAALRPEELQLLPPGARPPEQGGTYYRIRVKPDRPTVTVYGEEEPLKASMQVEAYVLLDRRPLYQWIMAPLYSVTHTVAAQ